MTSPLDGILPPAKDVERHSDELLGRFLDYVAGKSLELYPAQEEAILGLFEGKNLILNTPTGSGKTEERPVTLDEPRPREVPGPV